MMAATSNRLDLEEMGNGITDAEIEQLADGYGVAMRERLREAANRLNMALFCS